MFCKKCGSQIPDGSMFCVNCGQQTNEQLSNSNEVNRNPLSIIAGVIVIIACFLPYVTASVFGVSISNSLVKGGDGYIFLPIAVAYVILSYMDKRIPMIVLSSIMILFTLFEYINGENVLKDLGVVSGYVHYGIGFYVLIIGSILSLVVIFVRKKNKLQ